MFSALALMAQLAAASAAATSSCAVLPETGSIGAPAPDRVATPVPNADRTLRCPDDFRLNPQARPPRCVAPGLGAVDGNPRASCYATLPLGPVDPLPVRSRPTRSCDQPKTVTIIRLTGANVGLGDAVLSIVPDAGITATTLSAIGGVPIAEDPVVQGCFVHQCRLVRLEITAKAAPVVRLQLALPGQPPVDAVLKLPEYCPR